MSSPYLLHSVAFFCFVGAVSSTALAQSGTSDFRVLYPSSLTDSQRANYLARREQVLAGATVNGQPVTLSAPATTPTTIARVNGRVVLSTPSTISIAGKSVPVIQSIKATAAATGKLALALAKVAGPVGVAVTAYNLFQAVDGFMVNYKGPGEPLDVKKVTDTAITRTCYSALSYGLTTCYSRAQLAAILEPLYHSSQYADFGAVPFEQCQGHLSYVFWWSMPDRPTYFQKSCPAVVAVREDVGTGSTIEQSTEQALLDAIAARDGWPSGVVEDTIKAGLEDGLPLEVDETSKEISGPASAPGATTTTNNPDGSTTTNTTTNHMTYQGDNVTHNVTVVSQTCTGVGACQTTTSTTSNLPPEKPTEDYSVTDSAFGPVPTLYTPKYPDGLTGVWNTKKAELSGSSLAGLTAVLLPPMAEGGGVCPVWNLDLSLAQWANYGVVNVAPPCWIWAFAKTVIVLSALLLARALVFGG